MEVATSTEDLTLLRIDAESAGGKSGSRRDRHRTLRVVISDRANGPKIRLNATCWAGARTPAAPSSPPDALPPRKQPVRRRDLSAKD